MTEPRAAVNPMAVQAMAEVGIDMAGHRPKLLTPDLAEGKDLVITVECYI